MSNTMEHSLWYKLRYTPVLDFLRGRITARLDYYRPLDEAALPPSVKQVIRRVVSRTRLWRLERVDVTQELIAHFQDGIASGTSPDELIQAFGDPAEAARLIRRAKRRNRALPWQVLRVAGWCMTAPLVFYIGFAVYFYSGRPSPRIDYVDRINRAVERTPMENRAWPLYRQALLGLGPDRRLGIPALRLTVAPAGKAWTRVLQTVKEHPNELELIRQGGVKPAMGFLVGAGGSAYDAELWRKLWPHLRPPAVDPITGEELGGVLLSPPLQPLRNLAGMLRVDATLAHQERHGTRLQRDIDAILGLSRQVGENAPLLGGLVALSIYETGLDQIELTLRQDPTLIGTRDWMALADRLSAPKVASDLITFEAERMIFEDMIQRSFTDDGSGNGRLAPSRAFTGNGRGGRSLWLERAVQPAAALLVASRQEITGVYRGLSDRAAANLQLPMRETDWRSVQDDLNTLHSSATDPLILMPLLRITPAYWHTQEIAERHLGRREGLVVGIALEVFRREHGEYPRNLSLLVPQYLPEVPADRITGDPIRYRIVDARPLVYSVGADRRDDEGRMTLAPTAAANWDTKLNSVPQGDWVLYPTLR